MPKPCSIPNCKNNTREDGWFASHKFPKDKGLTNQWLTSFKNAGITKSFTSSSIICGEHFVGGRKTAQHSVPTIFPTTNSNGARVLVSYAPPQELELPLDDADLQNLEVDVEPRDATNKCKKKSRCNCEAYSDEMKEKITDLKIQISQMTVENRELKKCIDKLVIANKSLKNANDILEKKKVGREALAKYEEIVDYPNRLEYYTGFKSHDDFTALYNFLVPDFDANQSSERVHLPRNDVLTLKTQLLIVLIKLRLNLDNVDLAYRFGVPQALILKYWNSWIPVMRTRLSEIPTWPSPEICDKYRPSVFKEDGYEIVDGIFHRFEITVADSRTDQTETKKGFMALAPNGFFMFASDLVPNSLTDREVVLGTRILDKFTEGRGIMVDPDFLLEEECEKKNLRIMYLPTPNEAANLYAHVDNVTSKINYFRIICDTYDSASFEESSDELNSVWHICCYLLNFIENYDKQV